MSVTVERDTPSAESAAKSEDVTLKVGVRPQRWIGAWMKFGLIAVVQETSPAKAAGVQEGDKIVSINGKPVAEIDPLTWPDDVRRMAAEGAGKKVTLVLERDNAKVTVEISPRVPGTFNIPTARDRQVLVSNLGLGIAYHVEPVVAGVQANGIAKDKLVPGDEVLKVEIVAADEKLEKEEKENFSEYGFKNRPIDFADEDENPSWPWVSERILVSLSGASLKLTVRRNGATEEVTLPIVDQPGYNHVDRGIVLSAWKEIETASTFGEAVSKGLGETGFALTAVVRFLRKIIHDPGAGKNLGSVLTIGGAAGAAAQQGWAELLIFMTLISANLAVINFLPIPVLDGGHMVFLAYEGIRGKPADERVFGILTMIGFVLLLTLMVFVFWLDIQRYLLPN